MKTNLKEYIIEKLKLNKDIKINNANKEIIELIEDYLVSWTYIGNSENKRKCVVKDISDNKIMIYIEGESRLNFWNILGNDITKKLHNDFRISADFSKEIENNRIYIIINEKD